MVIVHRILWLDWNLTRAMTKNMSAPRYRYGLVLYDAIQTWWGTSLPEEERKVAYHTLASHKCTDLSEMEKIVQRYHRAKNRLPEHKKTLEELNKSYRKAKNALKSMETITYECQLYKGEAQEAAKKKSVFGASVRKAERKHQEQLAQQRQKELDLARKREADAALQHLEELEQKDQNKNESGIGSK